MALGLKGGHALAESGLGGEVGASLGAALALAVIVPALGYVALRRLAGPFDAAALAATYGSVSAVTFITAVQYLEARGLAYGGHMAAAMALMESPAIVMAVLLANVARRRPSAAGPAMRGAMDSAPVPPMRIGAILRESLTEGAQVLLLGAMCIGLLAGEAGHAAMKPFAGDLFKGMLALFLLDMGLLAARSLGSLDAASRSPGLLAYAVAAPVAHATLALGLSAALGLSPGNASLLMVLAASASYIAVPAVVRHAIPEANAALYVALPLGITFPLNVLAGIPIYAAAAHRALG